MCSYFTAFGRSNANIGTFGSAYDRTPLNMAVWKLNHRLEAEISIDPAAPPPPTAG